MKEINICDKTYEFKAPLSKLNVWLKKKTNGKYNVGRLGEYIQDDLYEATVNLIHFGIGDQMSKADLVKVSDEDFTVIADWTDFLMKYWKLDKVAVVEGAESGN